MTVELDAIRLGHKEFHLSIYKYKNKVGCRDDTMPKSADTRRHCEEE